VKITPANWLITSGSCINVEVFKKLGGYLEKLFIDEVDHEYCFRANLAGYQVLLFEHIFLSHNLGESREVNNFMKNRKLKRNIHSSTRLYYITRNSIYLKRKYKKNFPKEIAALEKDVLVRIKNRLLYADRKFYSLRLILLGIYHALCGRYGKL
jgi:rhamnosyltransferase